MLAEGLLGLKTKFLPRKNLSHEKKKSREVEGLSAWLPNACFPGTRVTGVKAPRYKGHDITKNLGEYKLMEIQPIIIENHQRSFEPLKTVTLPMMETIVSKQIGIGFHMSVISITAVVSFLLVGIIYWLYKHLNQKAQGGQVTKDEDVFQLGRGGVI